MEFQTQKKIFLFIVAVIILGLLFALYNLLFPNSSPENLSGQNSFSGENTLLSTTTSSEPSIISGNSLTNNQSSGNQIQTLQQRKILTISYPAVIANSRLQEQKLPLKEKFNIILQTKKFTNEAEYKIFLNKGFEGSGKEIDIALIPYERLDFFSGQIYKIAFSNASPSVESLFSEIFQESITDTKKTFIPVGIDPLITIHDTSSNPKTTEIGFEQLISFAQLFTIQKDKSIIPILFGADKNDIKLLETNQESFPHYSQILYQFFKLAYQNKNNKIISSLINMSNTTGGPRSYTNFKRTVAQLSKDNPDCELFPHICLFAFGKTKTVLSFLSDRENRSVSFPKAPLSQTDTTIKNIPRDQTCYPVRGRGFIINKNSPNLPQALNLINLYLKQGADQKLDTQNYLISPFNSALSVQQFEPRFAFLKKYISNFELINSSPETIHLFFTTTKALEVLKGTYNISLFLTNLKRKF
ncbi:MAG TPA: hypothetical protein PKD96_01340 [Candidatus Absconditabacterales bacterium]|nr:hypothetical protein [Candidatus Absconditabacterales bacterium]